MPVGTLTTYGSNAALAGCEPAPKLERMSLRGKTLFITGGSRGIGLAIAERAARDGANIAIAAKTETPHPKLEGTVFSAAARIEQCGGQALACVCDIRFEEQIQAAVAACVQRFGGIDILINNASAISLTPTLQTDAKRYDLMHQINARGTFLTSKACLPALSHAANPHILSLSPPLSLKPEFFAPHVAYSVAKFNMSLYALGMAEELRAQGIAVNCLWPATVIATSALKNLPGGESLAAHSRRPEIVADAAYEIITSPSREHTGHFHIDEAILRQRGMIDFDRYSVTPGAALAPDLFM